LRTRRARGIAFLALLDFTRTPPTCRHPRSHNAGYIINDGAESIAAWTRAENNTLGTWLSAAGYYTSFLGKYVNSMESHVPAGWSRWHGFSSGEVRTPCFAPPPRAAAPRGSTK
jgi:hypothetical protein